MKDNVLSIFPSKLLVALRVGYAVGIWDLASFQGM
jgi:hypothetical protein